MQSPDPTRRAALFPLLLAGLGLSGRAAAQAAGAAATQEVAHSRGVTRVPARPARVAVFDLALLDTLAALGVDLVRGVPGVKYPPSLQQFAAGRYAKVGTLFEPDLEAVNALKPDLVLVAGRSSARYAELARLAPALDLTVDPKRFIDSVHGNTETLGRLFGQSARAGELVGQSRVAIQALRKQATSAGKGLILLTTGGKLSAYGPGSRFGVLHDAFGFAPAQPALTVSLHGQAASHEFILQTNPDWLFVIDRDAAIGRDGQAARQLLDNELVRATTAWRRQQVVYLDSARWYTLGSAGISALQANVAQLAAALARAA